MNDKRNESLSALMDDEASEFEVRQVLAQLDNEGLATWSRYNQARAVIKGETPAAPMPGFTAELSAALADEPSYRGGRLNRPSLRPLLGAGVAASVTALVILGAQGLGIGGAAVPQQTFAKHDSELVLPRPEPVSGVVPAQYGKRAPAVPIEELDIIRLPSDMHQYIDRHEALLRGGERAWTAGWVPQSFALLRHEVFGGAEVMLYGNGRTTISVTVEPLGQQKAREGAVQQGDTVALGKSVRGQFVTVVGDVPLMMADRIASSVTPVVN
ncbi:MucB/RseB C-terminal domain-containing protein [Motiliproteus sp. SC1-56]|uniref:MucB/RseB C-terminal domain-containing protein n=1 Tax=Motiliproteus sp. SC1-56 TaxID=2799565 RepID=UPI001A8E1FE6|nr:MucB/RseB C-terminal domain-containing protein [Motiliproteus sp. SC1-56]